MSLPSPPPLHNGHGIYSTAMAVVPTAKPIPEAATAVHAPEATKHRSGSRKRQLVGGRNRTSMGSSIQGSPVYKPPDSRPQADPSADQLPQCPMAPQTFGGESTDPTPLTVPNCCYRTGTKQHSSARATKPPRSPPPSHAAPGHGNNVPSPLPFTDPGPAFPPPLPPLYRPPFPLHP